MTTIFAFVFMLGVLIFVHELGHFAMAKRLGIRVLTFSLGFGPKIIAFRRRDTEYRVSVVPLGGFVKMSGERPGEGVGQAYEFLSSTKWERFQVLVMGPVMNILLALLLTAVVFAVGREVPAFHDAPPIVAAVGNGSPAERAGIRPGDRITSIAGRAMSTWDDVYITVGSKPNRAIPITVLRDGRTVEVSAKTTAEGKYEIGELGAMPDINPHVVDVVPGAPAQEAGLKPGDLLLAINGERIVFQRQVAPAISRHANEPISLMIRRGGRQLELRPTPNAIGRIGITTRDAFKKAKPGVLVAIRMSVTQNIEFGALIYRTLAGLLTRETSPSQLMGPVAIAELAGQEARAGWLHYLLLMASISLNLGLLNLLPIPVLDGGHIFILAIEAVASRDFSRKVKQKMLVAGLVVLTLLMGAVIYNDLARIQWIARLMFWR